MSPVIPNTGGIVNTNSKFLTLNKKFKEILSSVMNNNTILNSSLGNIVNNSINNVNTSLNNNNNFKENQNTNNINPYNNNSNNSS
jgi:hypothetical protein